MSRPIVIVNPVSSGVELAPAFKAKGISCLGVTLDTLHGAGYGSTVRPSDFIALLSQGPELIEQLQAYDPLAILPGDELAIPLAEHLSEVLTPHFANHPAKAKHRQHKALMQEALQDCGVESLKTLNTASKATVKEWLKSHAMEDLPLIIKPPLSAGSDKVFHIPKHGDWQAAFDCVLSQPSKLTGKKNHTVVVQEQALGCEYAIGTVSANGKHYLAHLIQYHKMSFNGRDTVYDYVEFIPFCEAQHGEMFEYTKRVLDALGVRWGAAHNEIMLTRNGPRLIETGVRMCGGPVVQFARQATGSSQADKLVEIFTAGNVATKSYVFKQTVVPVFLKSPRQGNITNLDILDSVTQLPTFFKRYLWFQNGERVPKTVDYLSSLGIIALSGTKEAIQDDYQKIRSLESRLHIVGEPSV